MLKQTNSCCHLALVCQHMSTAYIRWGLPSHSYQLTGCLARWVFSPWILRSGVWPIFATFGVKPKCAASHPQALMVCPSQSWPSEGGTCFDCSTTIKWGMYVHNRTAKYCLKCNYSCLKKICITELCYNWWIRFCLQNQQYFVQWESDTINLLKAPKLVKVLLLRSIHIVLIGSLCPDRA